MTHCRYHCRSCGSHFTSLEAFDAHHQGSGRTLVPCAWPELPESSEWIEQPGVCKIDDPDEPALRVIIHRLEREGKYGAVRLETPRGRRKQAVTA